MKKKRKRVSVPLLKTEEVFDLKEAVLDQNLQAITNLPHETRGECLVKPLINACSRPSLRVCSENFLMPVDIDSQLLADYPRLNFASY
jgi:hypothetical protein